MIKQIYKLLVPEKWRNRLLINIHRLLSFWYLGSNFQCNCCNKSFRKMLSKGNIKRENAQCPYCGSLERTRVLLFFLKKETSIFQNMVSVLHIAPELAIFNLLHKLPIDYIDGDINPANARFKVDLTNLNFDNERFDYIICSHVLGHIPDEKKAISEMYRVMKSNGQAIIMTIQNRANAVTIEDKEIWSAEDKLNLYGENDLVRLHGMDFKDRLIISGFQVEEIDYRLQFDTKTQNKYSLGNGDREVIYLCKKR